MAGAGYKLFNTGDVLTAAQVNTYLQEQTVMVFASSAARTSALSGVLAEGMMSYLQDTNSVEVYNGTSWVNVGNAGDLTEIVAGTGITVTSGTGPIPTVALTTPVAATNGGTAQTTYTTGDLLYASATNTLSKRAIGSTGDVLTVSGGIPTWAAPAGGGSNWSLLNSGGTALTAATTITISSISGRDSILILITGASAVNASQAFSFRINGDTGSNYTNYFVENSVLSPYNSQFIYSASETTDKINVAATSNNAACAVNGYILISGCNAAGVKTFTGAAGTDFGGASPTGGSQRFYGGIYTGTSTVSSVSVVTAGSNFDAGTVYVYATN